MPDDDVRIAVGLSGSGYPGMHGRHGLVIDGVAGTMTKAFTGHISRVAKRWEGQKPRGPIDEAAARTLLREVDPLLSQALECCHFGCMPRRELARRVEVSETSIRLRLARARERIESWTGQPISDPVNREDPNVQALTEKWGGSDTMIEKSIRIGEGA